MQRRVCYQSDSCPWERTVSPIGGHAYRICPDYSITGVIAIVYVLHDLGSPVSPESGANLGNLFVASAFASAFWVVARLARRVPLV